MIRAGGGGAGGFGRLAVAVAVLAGACVDSEVTQIGAQRPSRPPGCPVEIFPSTTPPYPFAEVASARAKCHFTYGRTACIDELRRQACVAGADTVFGFSEGVRGEFTMISATLAARTGAAPSPPVAAARPPGPPPGVDCNPICSPGFACSAGQCVPQCNPPCEAGEVCSRKRTCEPAAGKLEPAKAGGTAP